VNLKPILNLCNPFLSFCGYIILNGDIQVDIKMIAECRWSWTTLMLLTLSCAVKQYETKVTKAFQCNYFNIEISKLFSSMTPMKYMDLTNR